MRGQQSTTTRTSLFLEVFLTFLKLGLTSFGGPTAHIGYFRNELIDKRKWVTESEFSQLLAISQFLPGPGSSQLGFALGLHRAGWAGGLAAFVAFTAPSASILYLFAHLLPYMESPIGMAATNGLKLVACAIVAHAVLGMLSKLCPDNMRRSIAAISTILLLVISSFFVQVGVVLTGAIAGMLLCKEIEPDKPAEAKSILSPKTAIVLIMAFFTILVTVSLIDSTAPSLLATAEVFYRTGALVFGGGHVVLPLLEESLVATKWISEAEFISGYGAAQAIPGPMFSFSAYLGAIIPHEGMPISGALTAIVFMFLPGFLLMAGVIPFWQSLSNLSMASKAIAGINAAVVGILGAALYDPIFISAVRSPIDMAIAIGGFCLLKLAKVSPIWVVIFCVGSSLATAII